MNESYVSDIMNDTQHQNIIIDPADELDENVPTEKDATNAENDEAMRCFRTNFKIVTVGRGLKQSYQK